MNKRINDLIEAAFQEHYGDSATPGARERAVELVSGWAEKFAMLIIQDCVKIDEDTEYIISNDEYYSVGSKIERHFGVD